MTLNDLTSKQHQTKLFSFYAKLPIIISSVTYAVSFIFGTSMSISFESVGIFLSSLIGSTIGAFLLYFCLAIPISYNILHLEYQKEISQKLTTLIENTTPKTEERTTEETN